MPGDGTVSLMRWILRSVLVKVPAFSAKLAAGRMTSACFAVSVRISSLTTSSSRSRRPGDEIGVVKIFREIGAQNERSRGAAKSRLRIGK